ncbi:MAG: N-acetylglucosamine kinase [Flavobacteriaceae bacterium]
MILIADGGSTKCDWVLLDISGNEVLRTRTSGLNPAVVPEEELKARIKENKDLQQVFKKVEVLDFYGAGCGTVTPKEILHKTLTSLFTNAAVTVDEDMVAAALAVTDQPGIVCIFGTGSNSCYFDGKTAKTNVDSLGFILMDEASGNYFGKRLIRDYFYKKMPAQIALDFEQIYDLNPDVIKTNLYKKPNPNTYLASFAEFIFTREEVNGYFYNLISEGVLKFIEYKILCYKEAQQVPIHFIGSIAHFSKDIIQDCLNRYNLELGNIVRRPIDGLIEYYRKNKLNSI